MNSKMVITWSTREHGVMLPLSEVPGSRIRQIEIGIREDQICLGNSHIT